MEPESDIVFVGWQFEKFFSLIGEEIKKDREVQFNLANVNKDTLEFLLNGFFQKNNKFFKDMNDELIKKHQNLKKDPNLNYEKESDRMVDEICDDWSFTLYEKLFPEQFEVYKIKNDKARSWKESKKKDNLKDYPLFLLKLESEFLPLRDSFSLM